jgi:hypothetical protein
MRWPTRPNRPELLDVDVDQLTGVLALVAAHPFGRFQCGDAVKAQTPQNAADGRW